MSEDTQERPVLFAFDGSDPARAAIEQAGREMRTGRKAIVLTVVEPLESIPFWGGAASPAVAAVTEGALAQARAAAEEGAELAQRAGFDADPMIDQGVPIWGRILEIAERVDAAVTVLGSRGRTGLEYVLLGSVATSVVHHSKCTVLISHAAGPDADA
jgi:nucleotide-binding universal stress UspA family protein